MKGALLAIAASALLGCVAAGDVHERRYAHQALHHLKRNTPAPADNATCGCVTIYTTVYGEATCKAIHRTFAERAFCCGDHTC